MELGVKVGIYKFATSDLPHPQIWVNVENLPNPRLMGQILACLDRVGPNNFKRSGNWTYEELRISPIRVYNVLA